MRIFAIGDTHLSRARPRPMDIFGEHWRDHGEHIRANWNAVAADVSWALRLEEARADLIFLTSYRSRKLLLRGNHDYLWNSLSRLRATAPAGIGFLQSDAHGYGGVAIPGTRGSV